MGVCPYCGVHYVDGVNYCLYCKRPVSGAPESDAADDAAKAKGKTKKRVFKSGIPLKWHLHEILGKIIRLCSKKWMKAVIALVFIAVAALSGLVVKDKAVVTENGSVIKAEQYFFDCTEPGERVYANIVSIYPAYGIYDKKDVYTHFVCECVTESGETLWLYITASDYVEFFNSDVREYADKISFPARRIGGLTQYADDLIKDFSKDIGNKMLMEFVYAD